MAATTKAVALTKSTTAVAPTQASKPTVRRASAGTQTRSRGTTNEMQRLQKGGGNHAASQSAMSKMATAPASVADLTVNQPGDAFERQAEAVAGSVMGGYSPSPAPKGGGAAPPPVLPTVAAMVRQPGAGRPLSPDMRSRLESRVGADLGHARIHEGPQAAATAHSLAARAFTAGNHIFLGAGESSSDARLMAHEATHVAQQQRGGTPAIQRTEDEGVLATAWAYTGGVAIEAGAELASEALEFTADTAWSIIEDLAPQLAQLIRDVQAAGGVFDYLKNLLGGVLDSLFSGVGEDSGVLEGFLGTFDALLAASQEILEPLLAGDCEPLFAAVGRLQETISQMAGDAWNAIVEFFQPVGDFFSDLWTDFGAPVVDWIGEVAGDIWQDIQDIASDIWEWTQPVRDAFASAWEWVKEQLGIGSDTEDSEGGLLAWVQQKLGEAWDAILELLEPVIAPIRGVVDQVLAVLPLDAILNLRETVQGWLENAGSMVQTMQEPDGVAAQQTSLRDEILPAVLATVASLREGIVNAGIWVANVIGSVVEQVNSFMAALSANSLVSHLVGLLQWVSDGVASLGQWAQETVVSLFGFIGDGLVYLSGFIEPILNLLQQLISVLSDLLGQLPNLITGGLWGAIPECITEPIKNFLIENILRHIPIFSQLLEIPDIWARISAVVMRILRQVFVDGNLFGAAWTFFSSLLELLGIPPELVTNILRNAINVFSTILEDPVGFLINLLSAVKEGFVKFFNNVGMHLLNGVTGWLFGQVQEAGLTPPTEFSLRGILGFILQILDITAERIFQRMEQNPRIGPERVALLRRALAIAETAWGWIATLINEGPGGLWRQLQERLSDLWQTVLTSVISWITNTIITTASARLLSMLDPTGIMAVVNSLIAIYRAIESFMQYLRQMLEVVNSVLAGVAGIARGAIEQAASFLESALARALPIAIGFLANQVGLGGISSRIREMVENVRQLVDRAIDWLIERGLALLDAVLSGVRGVTAGVRGLFSREIAAFSAPDQTHHISIEGAEGRPPRVIVASNHPTPLRPLLDLMGRRVNLLPVAQQAQANAHLGTAQAELAAIEAALPGQSDPAAITAQGARIGAHGTPLAAALHALFILYCNIPRPSAPTRSRGARMYVTANVTVEVPPGERALPRASVAGRTLTRPAGTTSPRPIMPTSRQRFTPYYPIEPAPEVARYVPLTHDLPDGVWRRFSEGGVRGGALMEAASQEGITTAGVPLRRVQTMTWNTGGGSGSTNGSHAEHQFVHWFESSERQDSSWAQRVRDLEIHNYPLSPCTLCAHELAGFLTARSSIRPATLFWQEAYVMDPEPGNPNISSTRGTLSTMESAGWIMQPTSAAIPEAGAATAPSENLCASQSLEDLLQSAGS